MRIVLKNIGVLREADVEVRGLTVVAGENNTGKSTIGKALFVLFNTLKHLDKKIASTKNDLIQQLIGQVFSKDPGFDFLDHYELSNEILELFSPSKQHDSSTIRESLSKLIEECSVDISESDFSELEQRLADILLYREKDIQKKTVESSLKKEFGQKINNVNFSDESAEIKLVIRNERTSVRFDKNRLISLDNTRNLQYQPLYFDDEASVALDICARNPYAVESFSEKAQQVISRLFVSSDVTPESIIRQELIRKSLAPIVKRFRELCGGKLVRQNRKISFLENETGVQLPVVNLSAGLKVFLLLQELISNGSLREQGTVILDEPEIHLHPQWQVRLAELIVLLQKAFKLHILIMTHSPYFVSALDIYAKKYKVIGDSRYYFVKRLSSGGVVEDVTQHLAVIYDSLAQPYQTIEDEAMRLEDACA